MKKSRRNAPGPVSLAKLRAGFIGLGSLLLIGLGASSWVVQKRLEEAKKDREEMVASRVFDEMEREISAFLQGEGERPPYHDLERTNPETWAPFVVGYFAEAVPGRIETTRIVGAEGSTSENKRRTAWALKQVFLDETQAPSLAQEGKSPPAPGSLGQAHQLHDAPEAAPAPSEPKKKAEASALPTQQKQASGSEIIQSLNRAPERRKVKPAAQKDEKNSDPFSDYSEQF